MAMLLFLFSQGSYEITLRKKLSADPRVLLENIPPHSGISPSCYNSLQQLLKHGNKTTIPSQKIFNSWGKVNVDKPHVQPHERYLGDYDGCRSVSEDAKGPTTQYCLTKFTTGRNRFISTAACIPSQCSLMDVTRIIRRYTMGDSKLTNSLKAKTSCRPVRQRLPKENLQLLWVPLAVVVACIGATLYDIADSLLSASNASTMDEPLGKLKRTVLSFSLYSNMRTKLKTSQSSSAINCLHGIKVFSMSWVALTHISIEIIQVAPRTNPTFFVKVYKSLPLSATIKGDVAVNTFFTVSGILASYTLLRQYQQKQYSGLQFLMSLPLRYFHRYIRLTPAYAFLMIINWKLVCYLYDGPFWPNCKDYHAICAKNWHYNMMYINNFKIIPGSQCVSASWYLAADMQLSLVAPFVVYALHKSKTFGPIICLMTIIASLKISYVISDRQHAPFVKTTGARFNFKQLKVHGWMFYFMPWQRYKSYGVGLLAGYILFQLRHLKKNIPQKINMLLWFTAAGLCISVVFGPFPVTAGQRPGTLFESNIFNTFSGAAWAVGISCVVISCSMGHGGWINSFLSCRLFLVLGDATFCAYLVHMPVSNMIINGRRYVPTLTFTSVYTEVYTCIAASFAVGFVFSLLFEIPFNNLSRIYLPQNSSKGRLPVNNGTVD